MMLRLLISIAVLGATGWLCHALWSAPGTLKKIVGGIRRGPSASSTKPDDHDGPRSSDIIEYIRALAYSLAACAALLLALTGFIPYALSGGEMDGFALLVHVLVAPVFAISVTVAILLQAQDQRFGEADRQWFSRRVLKLGGQGGGGTVLPARKVCFWLLVVLTPLVLGSIVLSLYPVFGTANQRSLRTLHLVSASAFWIVSVIHARIAVASPVPEIPARNVPNPEES